MTVPPILTHQRQPAQQEAAAAPADPQFPPADARRRARLARLDAGVLYLGLAFLAGVSPATFDDVMDAAEYCAAGEPDPAADPEPYCTACGGHAGIIWPLGPQWQHYAPDPSGNCRGAAYDPGHPPVIGWRTPATTLPAAAV